MSSARVIDACVGCLLMPVFSSGRSISCSRSHRVGPSKHRTKKNLHYMGTFASTYTTQSLQAGYVIYETLTFSDGRRCEGT